VADKKKDLHTLIRLRKWDVDEKQRALATLLRQEEGVIAKKAELEASIQNEIAVTAQLPADMRGTLPGFLKRCDAFRDALDAALADIRKRIAVAQDHLAESFRRLKTRRSSATWPRSKSRLGWRPLCSTRLDSTCTVENRPRASR
jgi:hypothetical protein